MSRSSGFSDSPPSNVASVQRDCFEDALRLIRSGDLDRAATTLRCLLTVEPSNAEAWYKLGNVLKDQGRPEEALISYQQAIQINPLHSASLCNRSVVLLNLGQTEEALRGFEEVIAVDADDAIAYYNRALAQQSLEQYDAALTSFARALAIRPDYSEAHFYRARLQERRGQWAEALQGYDQTLALSPGFPGLHSRRATTLVHLGRWHDALASLNHALSLDPADIVACLHRGNVLRELKQWNEALVSYDRAISLDSRFADAHYNRGVLLEQQRRISEAIASFDRAIEINPDHAQAQHNRSLALLLHGDLRRGFESYEWRWRNRPASLSAEQYHPEIRLWDGRETFQGRRVLVFSEQGLGDTLHFCRYVQYLASKEASVLFEVQEPLLELLRNLQGAAHVFARGSEIPPCDFKIPLLSLPRAMGTTLDTIPIEHGYLNVDQARVAVWKVRLGPRIRPRIGLVWSGNPSYPSDCNRSLPLDLLIKHLPSEFDYFCLQREVREEDRKVLEANPQIIDYAPDFTDTAALIENMDIVISVCTSVAHLTGALGRPLWLLLSYNADWRWFLERKDTPWYPSATIYRQASPADWAYVLKGVATNLQRSNFLNASLA